MIWAFFRFSGRSQLAVGKITGFTCYGFKAYFKKNPFMNDQGPGYAYLNFKNYKESWGLI